MKIILTQDVKKLGTRGQVLEVADGYARNYLLPRGLAEEANKTRLKEIQEQNQRQEKKKHQEKEKAEELKQRLDGQSVEIKVKTGGKDKLFGAVTTKEIADALNEKLGVDIDKKKIDVGEAIKQLGEFKIKIKIYPSVQAEINLIVSSE